DDGPRHWRSFAHHLRTPAPRRRRWHGAGAPNGRARSIRLLYLGAVVVAVLLRGGSRARPRSISGAAVRRPALSVRGAWAVAAVRERLSGKLPSPPAAARSQHRARDARPDAEPTADLSRMGRPRDLFGTRPAHLFRNDP